MFSKKNKDRIYIAIFLIIVLCGVIYKVFMNGSIGGFKRSSAEILTETSLSVTETASEQNVFVYICGAVNEPGVYELSRGSILNDAVILAGGLTEDAARDDIDLVMIIDSNISVKIPKEGEEMINITSEKKEDSGLININTASRDELKTLPGIGDSTADAIIEYRSENVFTDKEDIKNVPGIGDSKYEKVKDMICVN